jgi:hypothetical protein
MTDVSRKINDSVPSRTITPSSNIFISTLLIVKIAHVLNREAASLLFRIFVH